MNKQSIQNIIDIFPCKEWFVDIIAEQADELLPKDFVKTINDIISKLFGCNENKAIVSSNYDLEVIYELAWEHINMGIYKDVPSIWRKVYSISCLLLVYNNLKNMLKQMDLQLLKKSLYLCDMSLMMGGELKHDNNVGSVIAKNIHSIVVKIEGVKFKDQKFKTENLDYNELLSITSEKCVPLAKIDSPSIIEFLEILHKNVPVILTNVINDWSALSSNKWSVEYIKEKCGYRTVPIEIGSSYANSDWTQKLMTVNEFIDEYFYESNNTSIAYMAQHYLFSQISELYDHISIPDYCFINSSVEKNEVDINGWFGPAGTVSPLHQDPKPNFLCQVFGEKYIKLYLSNQTEFLYPNSTTMLKNTSKVDVLNPDIKKFPLFAKAEGYYSYLKPGEILFIPPKCWHYVKSVSPSFSVNFWWNE